MRFYFQPKGQILQKYTLGFTFQSVSFRGYNESGKPEGIDAYYMENLVNDVKFLLKELGVEKFTLVIHSGARINSVLKINETSGDQF